MTGSFSPSVLVSIGRDTSVWTRSFLPSPSVSTSSSTHRSSLTQLASPDAKTACHMPFTNVGTAGAGAASADGTAADAAVVFGGSGDAPAELVATTPASAAVTVNALAFARRFPNSIPSTPLVDPALAAKSVAGRPAS